jgi:hypothetical protein
VTIQRDNHKRAFDFVNDDQRCVRLIFRDYEMSPTMQSIGR